MSINATGFIINFLCIKIKRKKIYGKEANEIKKQ